MRSLGPTEQAALKHWATPVTFPSGAALCREGDETADVFVIEAGWVTVSIDIGGHEQIIALRGPGDIVGERAVRTMGPRSATVTALNEVHAWVLPARRFTELLEDHPAALESVKHLDEERDAEDKFRRQAPGRARTERHLAELILATARRTGLDDQDDSAVIELPMPAAALASWASAAPDAVERYLRSWRRRGIVRDSGDPGVVVILLARLRRFHNRALLPPQRSSYDRPLWQAFTDGVGGTFDVFGATYGARPPLPALAAALEEDAHALCLVLGLAPEDENSGPEGAGR